MCYRALVSLPSCWLCSQGCSLCPTFPGGQSDGHCPTVLISLSSVWAESIFSLRTTSSSQESSSDLSVCQWLTMAELNGFQLPRWLSSLAIAASANSRCFPSLASDPFLNWRTSSILQLLSCLSRTDPLGPPLRCSSHHRLSYTFLSWHVQGWPKNQKSCLWFSQASSALYSAFACVCWSFVLMFSLTWRWWTQSSYLPGSFAGGNSVDSSAEVRQWSSCWASGWWLHAVACMAEACRGWNHFKWDHFSWKHFGWLPCLFFWMASP